MSVEKCHASSLGRSTLPDHLGLADIKTIKGSISGAYVKSGSLVPYSFCVVTNSPGSDLIHFLLLLPTSDGKTSNSNVFSNTEAVLVCAFPFHLAAQPNPTKICNMVFGILQTIWPDGSCADQTSWIQNKAEVTVNQLWELPKSGFSLRTRIPKFE